VVTVAGVVTGAADLAVGVDRDPTIDPRGCSATPSLSEKWVFVIC